MLNNKDAVKLLADFNQRADLSLETADELEAYHAEQEELIESLNEELCRARKTVQPYVKT